MINQDYIFIDTETGGLSPEDSCIIELAAIRTDPRGKVLASYTDKIVPDRPVTDSARKVNHYDEAEWKKTGIDFREAIRAFIRAIVSDRHDRVVFVGHFSDFDRRFIQSDAKRHGTEIPLSTRAWICTGALIWPYVYAGDLHSRKLSDVCHFLGIRHENPHTAPGDCKAACDVYWELMRRYSSALLARDAVDRTRLGPALRTVENFLKEF